MREPERGANLFTEYRTDALGRVTQTLGPEHTVDLGGTATTVRTASWILYHEANDNTDHHQTWFAQGYAQFNGSTGQWDNFTLTGPVSITKTDLTGRATDEIQATWPWPRTVADLLAARPTDPVNPFPQSSYVAWTAYKIQKSLVTATAVYDDIPSTSDDPDGDKFAGTAGVNYDETSYGYENYGIGKMGRLNKTVSPAGTITRYVLDAQGNVLSTWVGTNDTGASDANPAGSGGDNNMLKVGSSTFDADGNLTESRAWFDSGANNYYATRYQYDWRDRLTDVLSAANVLTHYEYDNLDQSTDVLTYADADNDYFVYTTGRITGTNVETAELRAQSEEFHDNLGQVYESRSYEVNPTSGAVGDYLMSETWYDSRGQVVKTATEAGLFRKFAYDGVGRLVASYTSYDAAEHVMTDSLAKYQAAMTVDGDTVIDETQIWYDRAGQPIGSATYQRMPDDATTTGALTAANSYATAAVVWYDGVGRAVATADYGREDVGSSLMHYFFHQTSGTDAGGNYSAGDLIDVDRDGIPDEAQDTPPEPYTPETQDSMAGIDFQLSLTQYDPATGRAYRSIDNLGRINETQYDDAGRVIRTIQNYQNGTLEETDTDEDVTVEYEYDSAGRLVTMIAYNAKGDDSDPNNENVQAQATKYLYESTINASWQTAVVYPDSTDTLSPDGTTKVWTITTDLGDHVSTQYDRLGRTTQTTDQRGVVHAYAFDSAGRPAADKVTSLGSTGIVDDAVLRIGTAYDDIGRVQAVTTYSDTAGIAPVNQVKYVYNGWGQVAQEYQEHNGPVDASTLYVQYDYDTAVHGARLKSVRYPNGRLVHYGYGTPEAIDDIMSRLATIGDGTNTHASFKYLGAARIVEEDYQQASVKLSYLDSSGNVTGLDRFGRVIHQLWADYAENPDVTLDEYSYAYDRAGNRTSRTNGLHNAFSETFDYNAVDALVSSVRDDDFDQSWDLDGLGNWSGFNDDGSSQTRTANSANEITGISGGWATPAYDRAGNMTTVPSPVAGNAGRALGAKYDAWNRLVELSDGGTVVGKFSYDAAGRRILKQTDTDLDGILDRFQHFFHDGQQVIETRQAATLEEQPEQADPEHQFVWSPRYIDALILRDEYSGGEIQPASRLYYLNDANFNVTALLDNSGDVVERYDYSPYGKVTIYTPIWSSPHESSARANTTLYTGRELDPETGLNYYRARYYSADLGRFVARDPIAFAGGDENLYGYVGNGPTDSTDPLGLYEGYWTEVGRTAQGYFWDGPVGIVSGVYNTFRHPVDTAVGIGTAVWHPIDTATAIKDDIVNKAHTSRGSGQLGFDAASLLLPAGLAAKAKYAQKLRLARDAVEAARTAKLTLARNGLRCGGKVAPGTFADQMTPAEAARYQKYWEAHNPVHSKPFDIRQRYSTTDGQPTWTTYDQFGRRHTEYKFQDPYHGPHQHNYEYGPRSPDGVRLPASPIDE